jgi:hypothetical protein
MPRLTCTIAPLQVVIVCEPEGSSLMMGGLHPRGSLFERPVNIESAKAHHTNFRQARRRTTRGVGRSSSPPLACAFVFGSVFCHSAMALPFTSLCPCASRNPNQTKTLVRSET